MSPKFITTQQYRGKNIGQYQEWPTQINIRPYL